MIAYQPVSVFSPALVWSLTAICLFVVGIACAIEWRPSAIRRVGRAAMVACGLVVVTFAVIGCIWLCGCGWWTLGCAI